MQCTALYIGGYLHDYHGLPEACSRCLYRKVTRWPYRQGDPILCDPCRAKPPDPSDRHVRWLWMATVTGIRRKVDPSPAQEDYWSECHFHADPRPVAGNRALRRAQRRAQNRAPRRRHRK
jgi:hypothetical protein